MPGTMLEQRFAAEQLAASLRHPNIVSIFDIFVVNDRVVVAMEYLEGENLAATIKRNDLPILARLRVLTQVLDAIDYVHGRGLACCDLKPANVQVLRDGTIKLLDLDTARPPAARESFLLGTLAYMAPEQFKGTVDARSDIYAVGAIAYELLTGRRPLEPADSEAPKVVAWVQAKEQAPPLLRIGWSAEIPGFDQLIQRAMAVSPADRYPTARAMREDLTRLIDTVERRAAERNEDVAAPFAIPDSAGAKVAGTLRTVGRYQLFQPLATGAFGQIYRGFDPEIDREVAIKIVQTDDADVPAGTTVPPP